MAVMLAAAPAAAQDTLPASEGGYVRSVGLPEIFKPYLATSIGMIRTDVTHLTAQARYGVYRDVGPADIGVLGWAAEYRAGFQDARVDHGPRFLVQSNMLGLGVGFDYSVPTGRADLFLTAIAPLRRGGLFGRGTDLRVEWLPTHRGAVNVVFTVPMHQPWRGATRPMRDYAAMAPVNLRPVTYSGAFDPALVPVLEELRESALWVGRLVAPRLRTGGGDAIESSRRAIRPVADHLATTTVEAEVRRYHAAMRRAFAIALRTAPDEGHPGLADSVATTARRALLDHLLLPYDRLLGQRKARDWTGELAVHASGVFARRIVGSGLVPAQQLDGVLYVFQYLTRVVEDVRRDRRAAWDDSRLMWLPLQLGLLPEEHDDQEELDTLVGRAVGRPLTHGNRLFYVHNDRFQFELIRSIQRAEDYHILWVHDFRGLNRERRVDSLSVVVSTQAYLRTLRDRVLAYDRTGTLPVFMIFLDQHYFEANRSRALLELLADPLGRQVALPGLTPGERAALEESQRQLVDAVAGSRLLQAERAQHGSTWLRRLVKVHVNITNPADPTFRSRHILPVVGVPDDIMRDHRKIVLYDISEADPYRGMAIYTGMGVGEHYTGPTWEDRAIMLQGPAALALRDQARSLLETHGLRGPLVPHVLRPRPFAPDYWTRVRSEIDSLDRLGRGATRAIELHNATGFATKEISVADATLFSLLPPGVLKVPDSLWLNEFLASLLTGAGLRGVQVLMIMPGAATAPSAGWPQLSMMQDLASRVLAIQQDLQPHFARAGGALRLGLYDAREGVDDLGHRLLALGHRLASTPFLRDVYGFHPSFYAMLDSAEAMFGGSVARPDTAAPLASRPKLHLKGFFYLARPVWTRLISDTVMTAGVRAFVMERMMQLQSGAAVGEEGMANAMQSIGADMINPILARVPVEERNCRPGETRCGGGKWIMYLQIGSANMDYRSMVMDGEAAVLVSQWTSLYALPDFVMLTGLTAWVEHQEDLERLLPRYGGPKRAISRWIRLML